MPNPQPDSFPPPWEREGYKGSPLSRFAAEIGKGGALSAMQTPDLAFPTLATAATALRRHRISSVELTRSALDRAKALNSRIAAMSDASPAKVAEKTSERIVPGPVAGAFTSWFGEPKTVHAQELPSTEAAIVTVPRQRNEKICWFA